MSEVLKDLERLTRVRTGEPLSRHTTLGIGGPADIYAVADSEDALRGLVSVARRHELPIFILGSGSNILVGDEGFRGLVIENNAAELRGPQPGSNGSFVVEVGSGMSFASLARRLSADGWVGLEWAVGIPGTIGGAVVFNAGAYGRCTADVLRFVRILDLDGNVEELPASELHLSYRNSDLLRGRWLGSVLLSAVMEVGRGDDKALAERVAEYDAQRLSTQPRGRNCGSLFKNPEGHSAWQLIDSVGLRGHRVGDAQISEVHANFVLNLGHAKATDVIALIELAKARVWEQFGIMLEPEVRLVGEGFE